MTPPLAKNFQTKSPNTSPGYCTYLTYLLLGCSVIIAGIAPCTYFLSQTCTKAEEIVQKLCEPQLKRVRAITDVTVPDFGLSPIAVDVARKCDDVTECLSAVKCYRLRSISPIPERCSMFHFFNIRFLDCRQKLIDNAYQHNINCVRTFFVAGPIRCDLLNEHVNSVIEQIGELCDSDMEDEFRRHIDDYRSIIDCPESNSNSTNY